jgi:hypothetical protein
MVHCVIVSYGFDEETMRSLTGDGVWGLYGHVSCRLWAPARVWKLDDLGITCGVGRIILGSRPVAGQYTMLVKGGWVLTLCCY